LNIEVAERAVIGLADLAEYGDRRRWAWRTLILAAATGVLMFLAWVEAAEPRLLGFASLALIGGGLALAASIYGGRRFDVIPSGVTRLAGAPKPIVDSLIELAIIRDELTQWLANDWSLEEPTDLLVRTRDWLNGLGRLPASSREWLARREVGAAGIYAALRRILTSSEINRRSALLLLRRAIVEFEQACEREELGFDPYRGTLRRAPEGLRARTRGRCERSAEVGRTLTKMTRRIRVFVAALMLLALAGLYLLERWWSEHAPFDLYTPELGFTLLAFVPVGLWLSTQVFEQSSRMVLARLIGGDAAPIGARALRAARIEGLVTIAVVAVVLAVSFGVPIHVLHGWAEHRILHPSSVYRMAHVNVMRSLLALPSVTVVVVTLATAAGWGLSRVAARRRAARLEARAVPGTPLPLALLDLVRARGELRLVGLREQPELLRTIASGLALAAELDWADFDVRPAQALLGPALARGGIMTRRELLALDLELRTLEPALSRACHRYCMIAAG
jgi:hypothetical protein